MLPGRSHSGRRVFAGATTNAVRAMMRRACTAAGIAHYSPHDLRHRYISLLAAQGVPLPEVAAAAGHRRSSLTLDTYAHVLVDE